MYMSASNYVTKPDTATKKDSMKYVLSMCLVLAILIFARAASNIMFYAFALVSLAIFVFSSVSHCFSILLFLLPFATILKTGVNDMSFFTILFFLVVLKMIFEKKKLRITLLLSLMAFAMYCFAFSGLGMLTTVINMVAGMVMVYCLKTTSVDAEISVTAFSLGVIGSSVLALMKDVFPIVNVFVTDAMFRLEGDDYALRFVGLMGNPNYFTLDIIMILSAIIVMMYHKSSSPFYTVFFVALSIFGIMSVSKSFLLSWALLLIMWLFLAIKQGAGNFVKFLIIVFIGGGIVYFFAYDAINAYLFRFAEDSGGSLGDVTTGRTDIWKVYLDAIFNDVKILIFGNGLKTLADGAKGTHNTYLESLFELGLLGTGVFLTCVKTCMGKIVSKPIMWVPVITLLFRLLSIGILSHDNLWFYFGLLVVLSNETKNTDVVK